MSTQQLGQIRLDDSTEREAPLQQPQLPNGWEKELEEHLRAKHADLPTEVFGVAWSVLLRGITYEFSCGGLTFSRLPEIDDTAPIGVKLYRESRQYFQDHDEFWAT